MTPKPTPTDAPKARKPPFSSLLRVAAVVPVGRSVAVMSCLVIAGAAEGLGIASLLPLVTVVGGGGDQTKGMSGQIVHAIESVGLEPSLGLFVLILVASMCLKALLVLVALRQVGRAAADVATRMRLDLIEALMGARWSYYIRQPVGRFGAALSQEASQAGECYASVVKLAAQLIQVVVYAVVAMLFSWQLGVVALGAGLFMVLTLNRFMAISKETAWRQKRHIRSMVGGMTDLLVGIKPMKAMGRHARFQALFSRDADRIGRAQRKQVFAREANKALQEPILAIFLAAGVYVALGVYQIPAGQVIVMALLLARTVEAIGKAQQALQSVGVNQAGFKAISDSIEIARTMREQSHGGEKPNFEDRVEFRDVTFGFGDVEIIKGASFIAPRGKVTTITGASGAGKTTTVDLLLGLHEPLSGEILIDDRPLSSLDLIAWRKLTGYVPQELILFHDTLRANVTLGQPEFGDDDVARALDQAGANDFVAELADGVDTVVGERGARLSGGQRQRISIARALIHRPRLLILDEATTALDPETEANIVANVVELTRKTGLTVLAISHQPAWARASDNVVRLQDGRVVTEIRTPERGEAVSPLALAPTA